MTKNKTLLTKIRKSAVYKRTNIQRNTNNNKNKIRLFPNNITKKILIIGIDQAIVNTGFGILYFDFDTNCLDVLSLFGNPKVNSDLINNLIIVNDSNRTKSWPEYESAYIELITKLDIIKYLIKVLLLEKKLNKEELTIFVVVEDVYYGKYKNVFKGLIKQQTIVIERFRELWDIKTNIYEYSSSEAKSAISVGRTKDAVSESINKLFDLYLPTVQSVVKKEFTEQQYKYFTHISDGIALAYALYKDLLKSTNNVDIFKEN